MTVSDKSSVLHVKLDVGPGGTIRCTLDENHPHPDYWQKMLSSLKSKTKLDLSTIKSDGKFGFMIAYSNTAWPNFYKGHQALFEALAEAFGVSTDNLFVTPLFPNKEMAYNEFLSLVNNNTRVGDEGLRSEIETQRYVAENGRWPGDPDDGFNFH